jgi:hypothetical protein
MQNAQSFVFNQSKLFLDKNVVTPGLYPKVLCRCLQNLHNQKLKCLCALTKTFSWNSTLTIKKYMNYHSCFDLNIYSLHWNFITQKYFTPFSSCFNSTTRGLCTCGRVIISMPKEWDFLRPKIEVVKTRARVTKKLALKYYELGCQITYMYTFSYRKSEFLNILESLEVKIFCTYGRYLVFFKVIWYIFPPPCDMLYEEKSGNLDYVA